MLWLLMGGLLSPSWAARLPASSTANTSELFFNASKNDWTVLTSTAFFSKPTTLIEHKGIEKLRGIVSSRWGYLKKGQTFSEKRRLDEICRNIPLSYSATKNHTVVRAKVNPAPIAHCRIQVRDKDGLVIEQVLFVSKGTKKKGSYVTHTVTFFYPVADQERATAEVTKFLGTVTLGTAYRRRKDG